jgi:outer membrane protein assembly factor BamB
MRLDIILLMFLAGAGSTDDWLRFRGPNGSGVSETTGIPAVFGPSRNVLWKTTVPFGRSSPIVARDRIFLTASEGENLITLCLDRKTGKVMWRREVKRARHMPMFKGNDPASPTPVSDGTNVYVFFAELGLISYGPDGRERWRVPLGPFNSFYGLGASPVLTGDTLVMVCDQRTGSFVIAVDARDGQVRWKVNRSSPVEGYATPIVYSARDGEPQLLVFGSLALEAYSLKDGQRLWWVGGVGYAPKGVPVLGRDMVFVSAPGGDAPVFPPFEEGLKQFDKDGDRRVQREETRRDPYIYEHFGWMDPNGDGTIERAEYDLVWTTSGAGHGLTAIRPGGKGDMTSTGIVWRVKKGYPNVPAPLLYKNVLYLARTGGVITSLNPETGAVIKVGRSESAIEEYYSSPVAADNKIFMISESGRVTVLKAGGQWEILTVNDLDEEVWATPAIANGTIYIRTRSALYAFTKSE